MQFKCASYPEIPCGTIATYEPGIDTLNYYLPQCSSGITGVTGNAGVVYQDVFPNTDFHFYSNADGMKNFIRFKPGSNPNNFVLKFTGQDSIVALGSFVAVFVNGYAFSLPVADAYEVDALGNVIPVSWAPSWVALGNGELGIMTGSYSLSNDLIIRIGIPNKSRTTAGDNLYWSTYYGTGLHSPLANQGTSVEEVPLICANASDDVFHAMTINAGFFSTSSTTLLPSGGAHDCYISKFEKNLNPSVAAPGAPVRKWATYFGGAGDDKPRAIVEGDPGSSTGDVYVGGMSTTGTLPSKSAPSPAFHQASGNGGADGFIASFNKMTGQLQYDTHFGGSGDDEVTCMASDPANNTLYFGGLTGSTTTSTSCSTPTSTQFSLCAGSGTRYSQITPAGSFVASLDMNTKALTWSTYFGSSSYITEVRSIAVSGTGSSHSVYIGGHTEMNPASSNSSDWTSPKTNPPTTLSGAALFPICDPGGGAYFQSVTGYSTYGNVWEGFIARFDNNWKLAWNTFFGGSGEDLVWKLGTTSSGELYVTGVTSTDVENKSPTTINYAQNNGEFPTYYTKGAYHQSFAGVSAGGTNPPFFNAFIARFNASQNLSWCSYYGGSGGAFQWWPPSGNPYGITCDLAIDPAGGAYMSGFSKVDNSQSPVGDIPICGTCAPSGKYNQSQNSSTGSSSDEDTYDGWLVQFNSTNYPVWITNFGGQVQKQGSFNPWMTTGHDPNADERINAIALGGSGSNTTLYMTGTTRCDNTPVRDFDIHSSNDYFQGLYSGDGDVFIGRFNAVSTTVGVGSNPASYSRNPNLQVSPNPSSGIFDVKYYPASNDADAKVKVVNELGQVVHTMTSPVRNRQAKFALDLGSLPSGLYILNVAGESTTLIKK